MKNSYDTKDILKVGNRRYEIFRLGRLGGNVASLPYCLKILLENLLRHEDGVTVTRHDIDALLTWPREKKEIQYMPARVLLQDFTGIPAIVDLAAMRDKMSELGGDPSKINPVQPVELVIDHSIQVDDFGHPGAFEKNMKCDYARNGERYAFLRWGQQAFSNLQVVPPNGGICHQVNLEHLARVVFSSEKTSSMPQAYPDTCIGTDSHTPMVNGLGVLAWGVGGIEAEATMLGQSISMLIPDVIGFKLEGAMREGVTATDLVLTITEMLRKKGVVGKFVEFYGPGIAALTIADRATIGNMSPEYGATCAIFPPDENTLSYLRLTGRSTDQVALVEIYMKEQELFHKVESPEPRFTDTLKLDLQQVEPSIAGPRRPQDRVPLAKIKESFAKILPELKTTKDDGGKPSDTDLTDGSIVIAAITSCTNTSNPSVMIAAGLLAKKAVERGLKRKPWVKTSLAPGSRAVTDYLGKAGLTRYLDQLGFNLVGYGCTTCIGNSGPLIAEVSQQVQDNHLVVASVLSGNRNFEGRINSEVRANYLMSPPLVVAFALVGHMQWDPRGEPMGKDEKGQEIFLKELWPKQIEIEAVITACIKDDIFRKTYSEIFKGDERWNSLPVPEGDLFRWDPKSSYVRKPNYFQEMPKEAPSSVADLSGVRALAVLGDSVTTDHISPAGSIKKDSPAGKYLLENGVALKDFNSYGSRRGNHEVMVRGTFANIRIRNRLAPGVEGGFTTYFPKNQVLPIYDAAVLYEKDKTPLCVIAGKEYGSGSSRDWAAKGPYLQGIKFVLAESFERIHRSNLVGMGILPLQFASGQNLESLGLSGTETFAVVGLKTLTSAATKEVEIHATPKSGKTITFSAVPRIDTPQELQYYLHGGILQFIIRKLNDGKVKLTATGGGATNTEQPAPDSTNPDEASEDSFPASDPPGY